MFRRATTGLATAALASILLAACAGSSPDAPSEDCVPEHSFETISDGFLTVSTYILPPFSTVKGQEVDAVDGVPLTHGGELEGVDGEILKEFAAKECLEIQVSTTAAAAVIPAVRAGTADIGSGDWYRTAERAEIVGLSDPVYSDQMGIVSADGISDVAELQDRKVGTVLGYLFVADLRDYLGDGLVLYNSPVTMYQELKAGRIDAAIDSVGVGESYTEGTDLQSVVAEPSEAVAASLEPAQSAFLVQQGKDDLLVAINAHIEQLRASGRLAEILEEHGLDGSAAEPGEPRLIGG